MYINIVLSFLLCKYYIDYYFDLKNKKFDVLPKIELDKIDNVIKIVDENINKFKDVLENRFSKEELKFFYRNIKTLKIFKKFIYSNIFTNIITKGYYNTRKNKIVLGINSDKDITIFHELFHLSSSYYEKNIIYSGFFQYNDMKLENYSFGKGINEGYTSLMVERYFDNDYSYLLEKRIMFLVEKIVGETMENLYLNADLHGLIKELEKYESRENIYRFIQNMDIIVSRKIKNEALLKIIPDQIIGFLYSIYINKYKNKNLTKEEYQFCIDDLKYSLKDIMMYFKANDYKVMTKKELDEIDDEKIKKLTNVNILYI